MTQQYTNVFNQLIESPLYIASSMSLFEIHCVAFQLVPRDNRILIGTDIYNVRGQCSLGFGFVCTNESINTTQTCSKKFLNIHYNVELRIKKNTYRN